MGEIVFFIYWKLLFFGMYRRKGHPKIYMYRNEWDRGSRFIAQTVQIS